MNHFAPYPWMALIALSISPAAQSNLDAGVPNEVTTWLREHAVAISNDAERIAALSAPLAKARVLCLGDAAAGGAREPSVFEHKLLVHAVTELDVRALAIDANATECAALDEYVMTGSGDPAAIVASLRAPRWRTREFLDTVAWLRAWNLKPAHTHKVRLVGIDVQYTQLAAQQIGEYIQKVDYEAALRITSVLAPLRQVDQDGRPRYASAPPELRYVTMVYLPELQAMIEENREEHVKASSEAEWKRAKEAVAFLIQAEEVMRAAIEGTDPSVHDRVRADNVARALEGAGDGGRVMVWTDLARASSGMGAALGERFKTECIRIGLTFASGPDIARHGELSAPEIASLETLRGGARPARAWIELWDLPHEGVVADWFRELRTRLDVIVFFESVSAAAR